ncbi:MAG: hypothetical protein ACK5XA_08425 [Tagaea sp.]
MPRTRRPQASRRAGRTLPNLGHDRLELADLELDLPSRWDTDRDLAASLGIDLDAEHDAELSGYRRLAGRL